MWTGGFGGKLVGGGKYYTVLNFKSSAVVPKSNSENHPRSFSECTVLTCSIVLK